MAMVARAVVVGSNRSTGPDMEVIVRNCTLCVPYFRHVEEFVVRHAFEPTYPFRQHNPFAIIPPS